MVYWIKLKVSELKRNEINGTINIFYKNMQCVFYIVVENGKKLMKVEGKKMMEINGRKGEEIKEGRRQN